MTLTERNQQVYIDIKFSVHKEHLNSSVKEMKKQLVIEIGTNTIKMLYAERDGAVWKILSDDLYPTRIGAGKAQTGRLSADGITRSLTAIGDIISKRSDLKVNGIHIIATESLRSADNANEFINAVREQFGLSVDIISGLDEARYAFLAAASEPLDPEGTIAVLDIGGGSTELTIGKKDEIIHQQSYQVGAVKLTEQFMQNNPPWASEIEAAKVFVADQIQDISHAVSLSEMIGVGGSVTTLVLLAIPQEKSLIINIEEAISMIDRTYLSLDQISDFITKLSALTVQERERLPLMPKGRADIILAGTLILDIMMRRLNMQKITVSTRGVRYGYLYSRCS